MHTHVKIASILCIHLLLFAPFPATAALLRPCLKQLSAKDTLCTVWVIFSDKDAGQPTSKCSPHALARRAKARFTPASADAPVTPRHIRGVEAMGGRCRNIFDWVNAASFSIPAAALPALAELPYVKEIIPVRTVTRKAPPKTNAAAAKKSSFDTSGVYGFSAMEMGIPSVPAAHDYLINTLKKVPGDGVVIGLFDSGFRLNHRCFTYALSRRAFIADSDFVEGGGRVSDPDSIRQAFRDAGSSPPEEHGSWTLSLIAGYDPGRFMGVAWGADFVLAKTEWVGRVMNGKEADVEIHAEEDNWASALVWAERLGVDIVSSSVAYKTGFTDSLGRSRPQDDYSFSAMDGSTTIISIAALEAAKRGMIIVNSAGNDGPDSCSINAPGDVQNVITVGGVATDKSVAVFSSRGPTADGRIKPDLVTQATVMYLPDIYSSDSASYFIGEQGTSFSAPVTAGICGLICQLHFRDSAADIRRRLYASCAFAPRQKAIDNSYGRGIPNALFACRLDSRDSALITLKVYPSIIDIVHKKQRLNLEFIAAPDNPLRYSQLLQVAIRDFSGGLVWGHAEYCAQNKPVNLQWPGSDAAFAPGMYYCIVTYAGKTYTRKFIILG